MRTLPPEGAQKSGQRPQKRGLSRAIGPCEHQRCPGRDLERQTADDGAAHRAVTRPDFRQRAARGSSNRLSRGQSPLYGSCEALRNAKCRQLASYKLGRNGRKAPQGLIRLKDGDLKLTMALPKGQSRSKTSSRQQHARRLGIRRHTGGAAPIVQTEGGRF